ncbi:MAG: hypothetical protein AAF581_16120 [Planctomycetota bacterium]
MSDDFISYQDALAELQLTEDELNDLVASGELRGFRDGDEVRFKHEDVANLKRSRETEPTIILSETQAEALGDIDEDEIVIDLDSMSTDETVLNIEGLLDDDTEGTTPIPGDSFLEDDDDLEIGGAVAAVGAVGAVGDETVLDTDDLDLDDDFDLDDDDDTLLADEDDTLAVGVGGGTRRMASVKKESHALWTVGLTVLLFLMLCPAVVLMNLMAGTYPGWVDEGYLTILNGMIEAVLDMF